MAFVTIGVKLPAHIARALVTVFFGVAGFPVAWWALPDAAASYEAFLLIIAYWIGPWLGVVFADQYLRRGQRIAGFLYDRSYSNWSGLLSFAIGLVVSVLLFSNQERFVGLHRPGRAAARRHHVLRRLPACRRAVTCCCAGRKIAAERVVA